MAQIIQRRSTGELMGAGFGSGLNQALNALIDKKMKDIQQRHTAKNLERGFKLSPEQAEAISQMDPAYGQLLLKNILDEPSQRSFADALAAGYGHQQQEQPGFLEYMQQQPSAPQPQMSPKATLALGGLQGQQMPQMIQGNQSLNNVLAAPQTEAWMNALQRYGMEGQPQAPQQQMMQQQASEQQIMERPGAHQQNMMPEQSSPGQRAEKIRAAIAGGRLKPQQAKMLMDEIKHLDTLEAKNRKLTAEERREQHAIEKEERPFYERTVKEYKEGQTAAKDINRVINLVQSGKVSNPTEDSFQRWMSSIFKVNLSDLRGADTEEFDKLTTGFVKNAKNWFGSRVTNADLKVFMRAIPTLSMTNEGKLRLLSSMKAATDAQRMRYDALKELRRLNGGHLPPYSEEKVEEMIAPELDKLAEAFINGSLTPKLTPEAEAANKRNWALRWIQGAAAGGGTVLGLLGGAVKSVGNVAGAVAGLPMME